MNPRVCAPGAPPAQPGPSEAAGRRAVLTRSTAILALGRFPGLPALLTGSAAALAIEATADATHPDAQLIRISGEHIANHAAFNTPGGFLESEDDPLWRAYERTEAAISAARPRTLEGVLAKALAAKNEARLYPDGEDIEEPLAQRWAWDVVNDLLRLAGRA